MPTTRVVRDGIDPYWNNLDFDFDYTWHPDDTEEPYIYHFGTQHQKTGGPIYSVPGATVHKYISSPRVTKTTIDDHWENTNDETFDYTWHPDETEEPYIYQFGTQWQKTGGPRYVMPGAETVKYVEHIRAVSNDIDMSKWVIPDGVDTEDFDLAGTQMKQKSHTSISLELNGKRQADQDM
jgi:hypothetical protein